MQHAIFCHQSRLDLWKIFKKVLLFNETLLKAANNEKNYMLLLRYYPILESGSVRVCVYQTTFFELI